MSDSDLREATVGPHPQAVRSDDELIDALVAGQARRPSAWPGGPDPDDQLVALLSGWRADAAAEPVRPLVSVQSAQAAIARGRSRRRLLPLTIAASVIVAVCAGLAVGAGTAQPGDPLWGLSRVIDSQRADSVTVALKVQTQLSTARAALAQGHTDVAANALADAQADLPAVRLEEGRNELAAEQQRLAEKLAQTPPGTPTDPDAPSTTQPAEPGPGGTPPPDVRAQEPSPPPAGPPASPPPNEAAGPPPASPPPAEQPPAAAPSNPAEPPSSPPADEGTPPAPAPDAAPAEAEQPPPPESQAAPPTRRPLLDVDLGILRVVL